MRAATVFPLQDGRKTSRFSLSYNHVSPHVPWQVFHRRHRGLTVDCASEKLRIHDLYLLLNLGFLKFWGDSQVMPFLPADIDVTIFILGSLVRT